MVYGNQTSYLTSNLSLVSILLLNDLTYLS